jgi:hypothetical protein
VTTSLSVRLDLPADAAGAFTLLTDPGYVEVVALGTGGVDPEIAVTRDEGGGTTTVSARSLPAEVPSYAKPFVGDTVRITETRVYGTADADGSRRGTLEVSFGTAPVAITGTLQLRPTATGTEVLVELSVKASVPFVGGKVEKFSAEQIERALSKEQMIIDERLA